MRILQICPKSPFPPTEGGPMAMKAIRDGLTQAGNHVHTFTLSTPKFRVDASLAVQINNFSYSFLDTSVYIWPAFFDLCLNRSHHVTRFYNVKIAVQIVKILQESVFDVVLIESIFMMPYFEIIRKHFNGLVILRAHNVEHVIWERVASNNRNLLKKGYLKILAWQLKQFELKCFSQVNAIAAISSADAKKIKTLWQNADVETISFAIESVKEKPARKEFTACFGHIGSMDWEPNTEGIDWFLRNVWPNVRSNFASATFHLAGRNMPSRFQTSEKEGVIIHGTVESATAFMHSLDALIVPLFSGSGVRIKIAEAMSVGVPVITTTIGAEGLNVSNKKDIIICDTVEAMTSEILDVIAHPDSLMDISAEAVNTIRQHHSPEVVTQNLISLFQRKM